MCVVGLAGDGGSGGAPAASEFVRSDEILQLFPDCIVRLPVCDYGEDGL